MKSIFNLLLAISITASPTLLAAELSFSAFSDRIHKNEFCSFDLNMPILIPGPDASPALRQLIDTANTAWKSRAEFLKREFVTDITSSTEMCRDNANSNQVDYRFEIKTPLNAEHISLVFTHYSYTGGAHGGAFLEAENFDVKTGLRWPSLAAIFDENKLPQIKTAILDKLKQDPDFDPEFGFNGWSKEASSLSKLNNFYFTNQGMAVFFQQYEVGPYAAGNITAYFDWDELKNLGIKISPEH